MIVELLRSKRDAVAELCARYGVVRLDVFGSALHDDFQAETSDLDLLVKFGRLEPYARVDAYFNLLDELRALFGRSVSREQAVAVHEGDLVLLSSFYSLERTASPI